jgi:hypothetical protein
MLKGLVFSDKSGAKNSAPFVVEATFENSSKNLEAK